jgi:hypothetical protein
LSPHLGIIDFGVPPTDPQFGQHASTFKNIPEIKSIRGYIFADRMRGYVEGRRDICCTLHSVVTTWKHLPESDIVEIQSPDTLSNLAETYILHNNKDWLVFGNDRVGSNGMGTLDLVNTANSIIPGK